MAEALISPGVFLRENDQSQITAGPITVGAALLGPTVVGQVNIPMLVTSYSQYKATFGTTFISGGNTLEYMTSQAAYNYFQQGGTSLLVTRVASGSYTPATGSTIPNSVSSVAGGVASTTFTAAANGSDTGSWNIIQVNCPSTAGTVSYYIYNYPYANTGSYFQSNEYLYVGVGSSAAGFPSNAVSSTSNWINYIATAVNNATGPINNVAVSGSTINLTFRAALAGTDGNNFQLSHSLATAPAYSNFTGGTNGVNSAAFVLETLSVGAIMNNDQGATTAVNGILPSGSASDVRWQITQANTASEIGRAHV